MKPAPGVSSEPTFWHLNIFKMLSESLMQRRRSRPWGGERGLVFSIFRGESLNGIEDAEPAQSQRQACEVWHSVYMTPLIRRRERSAKQIGIIHSAENGA